MATALQANEDITLVYAHNDPLAYNAYLAAKDAGARQEHHVPGHRRHPQRGRDLGRPGRPHRDLPHATPGAEGVRQGLKLMHGEKIEKKITLPTETITKENAPRHSEGQRALS